MSSNTNGSSRSYAIVGAGAIGGTLAWHLARAGHHVTVVDSDIAHVTAISEKGLVLERAGRRQAQHVAAALTPEQVDVPVRRVLLAVKAHATEKAAGWVADHLTDDGFVVSLQNGFNEDVIAQRVGSSRTVAAFVDLFADVVAPGIVNDGGAGAIAVGETSGQITARVREVVEDLQAWGPAVASDNVIGYLWSKMGFGAMLTATALADAPMGDLLDRHRPTMHALAEEVFAVAQAERIALEPFDAFVPNAYVAGVGEAERNQATDHLVAWLHTQSKNRSGIWRDIAVRHRATEVPTHYAPVLSSARVHGIDTPVLSALLEQLAQVEANPASMAEGRLAELDELSTRVRAA